MDLESVLILTQKYDEGDKLTQYSHDIASFLSDNGVETHLVCFGDAERKEKIGDLHLHEFSFDLHGDNYFSWSMLIQTEFMRKIRELVKEEKIQILHANDWLTVPASLIAHKLFDLPFFVTYHSIEEERGMDSRHSRQISEIEWEGINNASYVIVHDQETRDAMEVYDLPEKKIKLLEGSDWQNRLYDLYRQVKKVDSNLQNLEAESEDNNENFNAYMGVSS